MPSGLVCCETCEYIGYKYVAASCSLMNKEAFRSRPGLLGKPLAQDRRRHPKRSAGDPRNGKACWRTPSGQTILARHWHRIGGAIRNTLLWILGVLGHAWPKTMKRLGPSLLGEVLARDLRGHSTKSDSDPGSSRLIMLGQNSFMSIYGLQARHKS